MRKSTISLLLLIPALVFGQDKKPGAPTPGAGGGPPKEKVTVESKTKSCKKFDGLFTIYQDTTNGSAYLLLKKDMIGKEYIYFSYAENGLARVGLNRGSFRSNEVFSINRYYDRIEMAFENTAFYFDPKMALAKSAQANISKAVLFSEKIVAEDSAKGTILLDATSLLLDENFDPVKPNVPPALASFFFNLGRLNKAKSKYVSIRSYPKNTDVVVDLVYDNPSPANGGGKDVTDARSITVRLQHSFIEMPNNGFKPRRDDPRVGYFVQQVDDMTSTSATPFKDAINRWHLVKKEPNSPLSEPVEPIVWWIENTTPEEFRPIIMEAGLKWNEAFEKIGFRNAVQVKIQPDTATWDAGDIRYNVLRWTSSPYPPFGGYGPSFVNPRTGQILGADIMLEYVFFTNRAKQSDLFDANNALEEAILYQNEHRFCSAGNHLHHNNQLGFTHLQLIGAADAEKKEYLKQSLYYLVLHEMGHTFGLMHNMKASQLHLPKDIHNKKLTRDIGLIGSVMDYPAVNLALDKAKQGDYFTTKPGPYDHWAIEYGYSQAIDDPEQEEQRLNAILARSTEPALTFGNDADDMRSPGKAIDPRVMVNDLSGDAIAYSEERIQLVKKLLSGLKTKYARNGQSWQEMRQAYGILGSEMANALTSASRYIGGVYVERGFIGQKGAKQPFTPVPLADQKRAMSLLAKQCFSPNAFNIQADLASYLQEQRRGFNFFANGEDPKFHSRALNIQRSILEHLMSESVMQRLTDSRLYGNGYATVDMLNDLTTATFAEDAKTNVNTFRQNLQIEYVGRLIGIAGFKGKSGYDYLSQSAAVSQLKRIEALLRQPAVGLNAETRAHRDHLLLRISKAFRD